MELLVKLYQDKPSRIGVKYTYEYLAVRPYEDIIRKYPNETFNLKLEPQVNKINMTLQSEQSGGKVHYKQLDYKPDQLKKLEQAFQLQLILQFVHIYMDGNVPYIAKPFRKEQFITISSFEMIGVENSDNHF